MNRLLYHKATRGEEMSYVFTPKHKRNHKQNDWAQENQFCLQFSDTMKPTHYLASHQNLIMRNTKGVTKRVGKLSPRFLQVAPRISSQPNDVRTKNKKEDCPASIKFNYLNLLQLDRLESSSYVLHQNISEDIKKMIFYTKNQSSLQFLRQPY